MAFCWLAQLGCTALQSWPATDVCALDKWWTEAPDRVAARSAVLARAAAGRSVRTAPLNAARMAQRAAPTSKRMPPGQKPLGAASSASMPLLIRSFGFWRLAIYRDATPMGEWHLIKA